MPEGTFSQHPNAPKELPSDPREPHKRSDRLSQRTSGQIERLDLDPDYKAILRADHQLAQLERTVKARVGIGNAYNFVGDAREALYQASHAFAAELPAKVTTLLARALQRARA